MHWLETKMTGILSQSWETAIMKEMVFESTFLICIVPLFTFRNRNSLAFTSFSLSDKPRHLTLPKHKNELKRQQNVVTSSKLKWVSSASLRRPHPGTRRPCVKEGRGELWSCRGKTFWIFLQLPAPPWPYIAIFKLDRPFLWGRETAASLPKVAPAPNQLLMGPIK